MKRASASELNTMRSDVVGVETLLRIIKAARNDRHDDETAPPQSAIDAYRPRITETTAGYHLLHRKALRNASRWLAVITERDESFVHAPLFCSLVAATIRSRGVDCSREFTVKRLLVAAARSNCAAIIDALIERHPAHCSTVVLKSVLVEACMPLANARTDASALRTLMTEVWRRVDTIDIGQQMIVAVCRSDSAGPFGWLLRNSQCSNNAWTLRQRVDAQPAFNAKLYAYAVAFGAEHCVAVTLANDAALRHDIDRMLGPVSGLIARYAKIPRFSARTKRIRFVTLLSHFRLFDMSNDVLDAVIRAIATSRDGRNPIVSFDFGHLSLHKYEQLTHVIDDADSAPLLQLVVVNDMFADERIVRLAGRTSNEHLVKLLDRYCRVERRDFRELLIEAHESNAAAAVWRALAAQSSRYLVRGDDDAIDAASRERVAVMSDDKSQHIIEALLRAGGGTSSFELAVHLVERDGWQILDGWAALCAFVGDNEEHARFLERLIPERL